MSSTRVDASLFAHTMRGRGFTARRFAVRVFCYGRAVARARRRGDRGRRARIARWRTARSRES